MDLLFTEAFSLADIDRQIGDINHNISPAQYEIIRQVIYHTADFEYYSLIKFSEAVLSKGIEALRAGKSIVVDVPEIQVSIVPQLQHTFLNPVYCCATTNVPEVKIKTKAVYGLETLASKHSNAIFVIGQDQNTLTTLIELIENKIINPSLVIATAPVFGELAKKQSIKNYSIPSIYVDSSKGSATVASAILNSLVKLTWRAYQQDQG